MLQNRCVLIVLDGYGYSQSQKHNAIFSAHAPFMKSLIQQPSSTLLRASGNAVGLPEGQMGNSEVGHLHLGSGRHFQQGLLRIDQAMRTGIVEKNPAFLESLKKCGKNQGSVHIIGLFSEGGVHSHSRHLLELAHLVLRTSACYVSIHAILDGRDTPPKSAEAALTALDCWRLNLGKMGDRVRVASLSGRYYSMDRDNRWERTQKAYELYRAQKAEFVFKTAQEGLIYHYSSGLTDEFVPPSLITENNRVITEEDVFLFANFRADRARQLSHALVDMNFSHFHRIMGPLPMGHFWSLTVYDDTLGDYAILPEQTLNNTLGEYLALKGKKQLRLSETEKFAHVTFFFNGNRHPPFPNEDRLLIPSPKVATYDLQPEMSAPALTQALVQAIEETKYDFILCNYPNADMVGHTGIFEKTVQAIEVLDQCLQAVAQRALKAQVHLLITADHGNAEQMYDSRTQQAHTAHTEALVPLCYIGPLQGLKMRSGGELIDVAPSVLHLMQLAVPNEMEGKPLFVYPD